MKNMFIYLINVIKARRVVGDWMMMMMMMMILLIMLVLLLDCVSCYVPECTRPIIYHWLDDTSLRNESITLFADHPAHQKRIYLSFEQHTCLTKNGGKTRFFCNGYSFSLNCEKNTGGIEIESDQVILGLGKESTIWNHYSRMLITGNTITLGDSDMFLENDDAAVVKCDSDDASSHICVAKSGEVIYGESDEHHPIKLKLFSDNTASAVTPGIYSYLISNDKGIFRYKIQGSPLAFVCGENCVYKSDLWKENNLIVSRGADDDTLVLGTLARQHLKFAYDADKHEAYIQG